MELEEYITHMQGFSEGLYGRGLQEMIVPAAEQLYASIMSRAGGADVVDTAGYFDATVAKRQTFSQQNKKPVNVKPIQVAKPVVADFEMEVHEDSVVLGLTQKGGNKRKYYATSEELAAYTKDVETASEELSNKILKGE